MALIPLLEETGLRGAIHDRAPDVDPAAIRKIQRDEAAFVRELPERCLM